MQNTIVARSIAQLYNSIFNGRSAATKGRGDWSTVSNKKSNASGHIWRKPPRSPSQPHKIAHNVSYPPPPSSPSPRLLGRTTYRLHKKGTLTPLVRPTKRRRRQPIALPRAPPGLYWCRYDALFEPLPPRYLGRFPSALSPTEAPAHETAREWW